MVVAYAEMQNATVGRIMELRDVIEQHAMVVERTKDPRDEEPVTTQFFPGYRSVVRALSTGAWVPQGCPTVPAFRGTGEAWVTSPIQI